MEIINGEYVLNEEESYNLLNNKINRLNPYDEQVQSFIDNIDIKFVDDEIIVNIPEEKGSKIMAETTLNIQITLDDEQLKTLITDNIQDLPKDKLQDILLQGLNDYIKANSGNMFFTSNNYTTNLQNWVEIVFKSCIKDIAKDNEEMLINTIHEFLGEHFETVLMNSFTDVISLIFKNALNTEYIKQNVIDIMSNMNRNQ